MKSRGQFRFVVNRQKATGTISNFFNQSINQSINITSIFLTDISYNKMPSTSDVSVCSCISGTRAEKLGYRQNALRAAFLLFWLWESQSASPVTQNLQIYFIWCIFFFFFVRSYFILLLDDNDEGQKIKKKKNLTKESKAKTVDAKRRDERVFAGPVYSKNIGI